MILSSEELSAGQRAYQRLKVFERSRASSLSVIVIFLAISICGFYRGSYLSGIVWLALLPIDLWQRQVQKKNREKDFEYLGQLKAKYGPEVYSEIKKEPSSIYYYVFQKRYLPDVRQMAVNLP